MSRLRVVAIVVIGFALASVGCDDHGPQPPQTVGATYGQPCTSDGDCHGAGEQCSNHVFPNGTIYPTAVCITTCTVTDPTMLQVCAMDVSGRVLGYCSGTQAGQAGWCLPACAFDSTTYTFACAGGNACQVRGIGVDRGGDAGPIDAAPIDAGPVTHSGPTTYGVGVCWGGCKTDAECTMGDHCQVETGECLHDVTTFALPIGSPCNPQTDQGMCNCLGSSASAQGYCSRVCTTGGFDCQAGYVCTAQLPTSGMVRFSGQPNGIQGHCALRCVPPPNPDAGVHDAGTSDSGAMEAGMMDATTDASTDATTDVVVDTGPPPPMDSGPPPTMCPNSTCQSAAGVGNVCLP